MANIVPSLESRQKGELSFLQMKKLMFKNNCQKLVHSKNIDVEAAHTSPVNCLDLDNSGQYLLSGGKDGRLFIHDVINIQKEPYMRCNIFAVPDNASTMSVETVQWYPFDPGLFVTSGMDGYVKIWDSNCLIVVETINFGNRIYKHHLSPALGSTSSLIAVGTSMSHVNLIDMRSGEVSHELRGHTSAVMSCAWSPVTQHLLASGSCDSSLKLWDVRSSRSCLASLDALNRTLFTNTAAPRAHFGYVNGVTFTPNSRLLLSVGTDKMIRCWDILSLKNKQIDFGKTFVHKNKTVNFQVHGLGNYNLCFVPSEGNIEIYDVGSGERTRTLSGHYNIVHTCCFQPDRMELYSGGADRTIILWTHAEGEYEEGLGSSVHIQVERDSWSDSDSS